MGRVVVVVIALLLIAAAPSRGEAQQPVPVSSWVTELGGGAGADLIARGPWMDESWRRSSPRRIIFATFLSLLYEYAVEPWNGQTNAGKWQDAAQRLVGTLATELVGALFSGGKRKPAPASAP